MADGWLLAAPIGWGLNVFGNWIRPSSFLTQDVGSRRNPEDLEWTLGPWLSWQCSSRLPGYLQSPVGLWQRAPISLQGSPVKLSEVKLDEDSWNITLDVRHFLPEEIALKTKDGHLEISGTHEEKKDVFGYVSRHFRQKYRIPSEVIEESITASMSHGGVLRVKAPQLRYGTLPVETEIPVQVEIKSTQEPGSLFGLKDVPKEKERTSHEEQLRKVQASLTQEQKGMIETYQNVKEMFASEEDTISQRQSVAVEVEAQSMSEETKDSRRDASEEVEKQEAKQEDIPRKTEEMVDIEVKEPFEVTEEIGQDPQKCSKTTEYLTDSKEPEAEVTNILEEESPESQYFRDDEEKAKEDRNSGDEKLKDLVEDPHIKHEVLKHVQEANSDLDPSLEPGRTEISGAAPTQAGDAGLDEQAPEESLELNEEQVPKDQEVSSDSTESLPFWQQDTKKFEATGEYKEVPEEPVMPSDVPQHPADISDSRRSLPWEAQNQLESEATAADPLHSATQERECSSTEEPMSEEAEESDTETVS